MPVDIAVGPYSGPVPGGSSVARKPAYLLTLEDRSGKTVVTQRFISTEKPDLLQGFVQVKGVFTDIPEDEITSKFHDILTNSSKELFVEVMFPWHRVCSIRNLVFRAK